MLGGKGTVGAEGRHVHEGQLARFGAGDTVTLSASPEQDLDVLLLGGRPIGDPVEHYGPFVMNTREELSQAVMDFNLGKMDSIPQDGLRVYRGRA